MRAAKLRYTMIDHMWTEGRPLADTMCRVRGCPLQIWPRAVFGRSFESKKVLTQTLPKAS